MTQDLAIQLLRRHSSIAKRTMSQVRGGLSARQLRRACDLMGGKLDGQFTLAEVAVAVGCSPTHLSRAFKQSTGMPPFAWLHQERLARAQSLLNDPQLALSDIASSVGFSSQSHFTTAFRQRIGVDTRRVAAAKVDLGLAVDKHSRRALQRQRVRSLSSAIAFRPPETSPQRSRAELVGSEEAIPFSSGSSAHVRARQTA